MKTEGVNPEKIRQACEYIFNYLSIEEFNLKEMDYLLTSMKNAVGIMTEGDPLRAVSGFNYSSSLKELFSDKASSKT